MNAALTLAAVLETAINRWLRLDETSLDRLQPLQGRIIEWYIDGLGRSLYFVPGPQSMQVLSRYEGEVDTTISAGLGGLLQSLTRRPEDALFEHSLRISGDTELGQAFQDLLTSVDVDWEEQLSHITGDSIAHQAGKTLRALQLWLSDSSRTLRLDLSEYLQEEARILPTRIEIQHFLDQVDQLRTDTDRLEARIRRLRQAGNEP